MIGGLDCHFALYVKGKGRFINGGTRLTGQKEGGYSPRWGDAFAVKIGAEKESSGSRCITEKKNLTIGL